MPACQIEVVDERPELAEMRGAVKKVAHFHNVPESWSDDMVVERFGIAPHLTVYRSYLGGPRRLIQPGRRYRSPSL